ncbi:MAG: hypothetical protein OEW08_04300 [Gammaproteobacteria bacterium]|nr:hypothetical protein [Gammaproteobacteria bacterium]
MVIHRMKFYFLGLWAGMLLMSPAQAVVNVVISGVVGFTAIPGVNVVRQTVATATIDSSGQASYDVSLADDTGGVLVNGGNSFGYSISYNNQAEVTLSAVPTIVETSVANVTAGSRSIAVTVAGASVIGLPAGAYSSTITVTITGY